MLLDYVQSVLCRTLTNGRSKMFTAMFSGDLAVTRTPEARAFIDRDGERFGPILSFLRTGLRPELPASGPDLARMLDDAAFYQARRLLLTSLSSCCVNHSLYIKFLKLATVHRRPHLVLV